MRFSSTKLCQRPWCRYPYLNSRIPVSKQSDTRIHLSNAVSIDPDTYPTRIRPYQRRIVFICVSDTRYAGDVSCLCIVAFWIREIMLGLRGSFILWIIYKGFMISKVSGAVLFRDYNSGLSLYGDKVKPKTFAARFASADGYEVVSVVIRPSNSLKITFLEAKDITDLGSLKEAAKIFIPVGSTVYSARAIRIKEEEGFRTYYFYEFGVQEQHAALVAAVNGGKTYIAGATAPQSKWNDDGVKLRSAAISMTVL